MISDLHGFLLFELTASCNAACYRVVLFDCLVVGKSAWILDFALHMVAELCSRQNA